MIALVLEKGVGVVAGLRPMAAAEHVVARPDAGRYLRVLIELNEQDETEALQVTGRIIRVLDRAALALLRLLHGYGAAKWRLYCEALVRGLDAWIGLEDAVQSPFGERARDNAPLIRAARPMA